MPSGDALTNAFGTLGGIAQFDGEERRVSLRVAQGGGNIYLDLGDADWSVVEITPTGWSVRTAAQITAATFRRPRGMLALPRPDRGGSISGAASVVFDREGKAGKRLIYIAAVSKMATVSGEIREII